VITVCEISPAIKALRSLYYSDLQSFEITYSLYKYLHSQAQVYSCLHPPCLPQGLVSGSSFHYWLATCAGSVAMSKPQSFSPDSEFYSQQTPRAPSNSSLSITALARFEFEAGKSNNGTKILMVEWEDDDLARSPAGSWHVSWEGKKTVIPADEQTTENTRRFFFLLPPGVTIPPVVTLRYEPHPTSASTIRRPDSVPINPLPAIFPPELGATARTAGKKGVLHTLWAKKRLQALEKEIHEESLNNVEGVALHMAIQEKEWIESNFGVAMPSTSDNIHAASPTPSYPPTTPISPTGSRLVDKLKGLKLETAEKDLLKQKDGMTFSVLISTKPFCND
jgi:hypothetical protein